LGGVETVVEAEEEMERGERWRGTLTNIRSGVCARL
jgi:hypothetical protein